MDSKRKNVILARRGVQKNSSGLRPRPGGPKPAARPTSQLSADCVQNELGRVQKLRLSLRRELELAKQMRAEAERYRLQTETRARSEAQQLILETRLSIKREVAKLESEAGEQMKKVLLDIRLIRLAAQEELEAQQQFTSAAKISALSRASQVKAKLMSEE